MRKICVVLVAVMVALISELSASEFPEVIHESLKRVEVADTSLSAIVMAAMAAISKLSEESSEVPSVPTEEAGADSVDSPGFFEEEGAGEIILAVILAALYLLILCGVLPYWAGNMWWNNR